MQLPNVKELERLLKMCRKQGITKLVMSDMSFDFGDLPKESGEVEEENPHGLTDEQMAFYSVDPPLPEVNQ